MARFVSVLIVVLLAASSTAAEAVQSYKRIGELGRYLGNWKVHSEIKSCVWVPKGEKRTGVTDAKLILAGKFVQSIERSEKQEQLQIAHYDQKKNAYLLWGFSSDGNTNFWVGTWDEKSKTMTWKLNYGAIRGTMINRFLGPDKFETTVVVTDAKGRLLLEARGTETRVKK